MNALVFGRMFITASGVCLGLITPLQICYQETGSEASSFGGWGGGMLSTVCPLSGQFVTLPNSNKTFFFFFANHYCHSRQLSAWKFHKSVHDFFLVISCTLTDIGWKKGKCKEQKLYFFFSVKIKMWEQETASERWNYSYQDQRGRLCSKVDSSDRKRESFCRGGQVK